MEACASTDRVALLRAIADQPDCDTVRLVYADWLDESGTDPDRAEFIRTQIAGDRCSAFDPLRSLALKARADELTQLHRERWLRVECPKCGASGSRDMYDEVGDLRATVWCQWCDGTGDIGGLSHSCRNPAESYYSPVVWSRGFPDEVQGCRLADVFDYGGRLCDWCGGSGEDRVADAAGDMSAEQCRKCRGSGHMTAWAPSAWILRVFAHHPTLRKVPLADRVPYRLANDRYMWSLDESALAGVGYQASGLPLPLWRLAEPGGRGATGWESEAKAVEVLAVAVADVIRAHLARGAA